MMGTKSDISLRGSRPSPLLGSLLGWVLVAMFASVLLVGCGGRPPPEPEEEVGATWTSGDDVPLSESEEDGSQ